MGLDPRARAELSNQDVDDLFAMLKQLVGNTKRIADALEKNSAPAAREEIDIAAADSDVVVRRAPKKWKGDNFVGKKFSECSADFLDTLAGALEFRAEKEEEEPDRRKWAAGTRLEARKARAWAKHKRASSPASSGADDDLDKV